MEQIFTNPILNRAAEELFEQGCNRDYWAAPDGSMDYARAVLTSFQKSGIADSSPEKVYATIKTGILFTRGNVRFISKADRDDWDRYAREYERRRQ